MASGLLRVGDVVKVAFPSHVPGGMHEQENDRPAVVVGVPDDTGPARFGMLVILPFSSQNAGRLVWARQNPTLYPLVPAGVGGLRVDSIALVDQVRSIDARRVKDYLGALAPAEFQPIEAGLRRLLKM